jgi:hypothetical protein
MSRLTLLAILLCACSQPVDNRPASTTTTTETTATAATTPNPAAVVEELGRRMQRVSLLAPDAAKTIRETYVGLATPGLIDQWASDPAHAPGRQTSSPYPDHIEVSDVAMNAKGAVVTGDVVESTSTGEAGRTPVRVEVVRDGNGWIIDHYQSGESADAAVDALRAYYAAINARDYRKAYAMWGVSGPPNQTYEQFAKGFADTTSVRLETGEPSRVGAAAGSRYVEVPVVIVDGDKRFEGLYVMRRSVVEGGDPQWRIYRADIRVAK